MSFTKSGNEAHRRRSALAITPAQRAQHRRWLAELTAIPTAAGHEQRVVRWVRQWLKARPDLKLRTDRAGNLLISSAKRSGGSRARPPLLITAHLDHPAFVVRQARGDAVELEFRGGVHDPYFENAAIDIFDGADRVHWATITSMDASAKPFKRVQAKLARAAALAPGDIGRWSFDKSGCDEAFVERLPRFDDGMLRTHACDDLAAVAAALSALDVLRGRASARHVGLLLTRAEEVGFIGAIAACRSKSIPRKARLICLENSRSFADSPIGAGPIVRVGDKMSVFEPSLTNAVTMLMTEHHKEHPEFKWQRKLMPGGTCEATTFSAFGYQSTCLCLPLGNYHNMIDIDAVGAGARPALVGPEYISVDDYHGLIDMLVVCATKLDTTRALSLKSRMGQLWREHRSILRR